MKFAVISRYYDKNDTITAEALQAESSDSAWEYCESLICGSMDIWLIEYSALQRFMEVLKDANRKLSKMRLLHSERLVRGRDGILVPCLRKRCNKRSIKRHARRRKTNRIR